MVITRHGAGDGTLGVEVVIGEGIHDGISLQQGVEEIAQSFILFQMSYAA